MAGYNLGNYSSQLGLSYDEASRAYQAAGGNAFDLQANQPQQQQQAQAPAQPVQQQPQREKKEGKSGLGTVMDIIKMVL